MQTETAAPESWAILELMGHVRLAGRVSEEERFGAKMGRIDIPRPDGTFVTQYFGGSSIYRMTPTTEEVARRVAQTCEPRPVHPWELPKALPDPGSEIVAAETADDDDDGEDPDEAFDEEEDLDRDEM